MFSTRSKYLIDRKHVTYLPWIPIGVAQNDQNHVNYVHWIQLESQKNHTVHDLLKVNSNRTTVKLQRTRSKSSNSQSIFLTHLWPWNKVKVIRLRMIVQTASKVITMQSLKDLASIVSEKSPTLSLIFFNEEICQLFPFNMCENKK